MFKQIVSKLPFSPSLISSLGFYAKRLRQETFMRRLGLVFTVFALIIQSFAILAPPKSANAASANDIVSGGFANCSQILTAYDNDTQGFREIAAKFGISRETMTQMKLQDFRVNSRDYIWGRERKNFANSSVEIAGMNLYYQNLSEVYGENVTVKICAAADFAKDSKLDSSQRFGTTSGDNFAKNTMGAGILLNGGNIVTVDLPEFAMGSTENLQDLEAVEFSKSARNYSQGGVDATMVNAKANDVIIYTIVAKNNGDETAEFAIDDALHDVLEYADLADGGGGKFDEKTETLSWAVVLGAKKETSRDFTITMKKRIPAVAQGVSDLTSYDCKIDNFAGNLVRVKVDCPVAKSVIEQTISRNFPTVGVGTNLFSAVAILVVVGFFYARSRQLGREVRMVKNEFGEGKI